MQPSGGSRKPTPPPLPASRTFTQGGRANGGDGGFGGVFDDYAFRFSNTYTAVDTSVPDSQANQAGTSFGLPRRPLHGTTAQSAQTYIGPRSMLNYSASTNPAVASRTATTTATTAGSQKVKRGAKKDTTASSSTAASMPDAAQRAAVDQEAATRVLALLHNRRHVTAPLPQTRDNNLSTCPATTTPTTINAASSASSQPRPGEVEAVRTGGRRVPATHSLPAPALGKAAGAVHMGTNGGPLSLSAEDRAEALNEAFTHGELLFDVWQSRQHARLCASRHRGIERQLERALSDAVYGLLIQEEDYWIQALTHSPTAGAGPSVNPKLRPYGNSATVRTSSGSPAPNTSTRSNGLAVLGATSRGITVPLDFMEALFKGLRALLHQRTVSLLSSMRTNKQVLMGSDSQALTDGAATSSSPQSFPTSSATTAAQPSREAEVNAELIARAEADECAYMDALIKSERALGAQAVADTESSLLPSCVSLPPERIVAPVLVLETATAAVLLWKVLQQAQTVIPHMSFALTLYIHYVLPHLYDNFSLRAISAPQQLGSISDQVRQLAELPLRAHVDLAAREACQQATADVGYMETVIKTWALRSWREAVLAERRAQRQRAALEAAMMGLRRRTRVKQVLDAWRLVARESAQHTYMRNIEKAYRDFLHSSGVVAQVERFTLLGADEGAGPRPTAAATQSKTTDARGGVASDSNKGRLGGSAYNRAKFLATKLAENATHRKPAKRGANSPSRPVSPVRLPPVVSVGSGGRAVARGTAVRYIEDDKHEDDTTQTVATRPQQETEAESAPVAEVPAFDALDGEDAPPLPAAMTTLASPAPRDAHSASTTDDTTASAVTDEESEGAKGFSARAFQATTTTTFDTMLRKLHEMEEVCGHLQSEIAIQNSRVAKLEQEKFALADRNRTLEAKLLEAVDEKLHYCNVVQEKQLLLNDRNRRIAQLKSRLRAHRHRPWQKTVLRVIGELCGSSTHTAENADELRLFRAASSIGGDPGNAAAADGPRGKPSKSLNGQGGMPGVGGDTDAAAHENGTTAAADGRGEGEAAFAAQHAEEQEDRRLFGRLAPIVLSTTQNLPDALLILQDWTNSCLDDLESLDDIKGGALSLRVTTFSEELRNGVLLSRLLYYLALPRYLHSSGASSSGTSGEEDGSGKDSERRRQHGSAAVRRQLVAAVAGRTGSDGELIITPNFSERRGQLLEKRHVQLETPFPVYSECFGDLLDMRLSDRMTLLLQFATELVMGQGAPPSQSVDAAHVRLRQMLETTLGLSDPPAAGRLELTEVIDPHALAMGERASSVTLIALLYTRFAHPFNHKCKQSATLERAGILYLLSGGQWVHEDSARASSVSGTPYSPKPSISASVSAANGGGAAPLTTVEQELLACLDDEDKSPWQLFKERCLPVFGTSAHPFLLRGNFWPSDAFDSPDLAELLGELGMALNRSLQMHRWHITVSCLVPVLTFSGLSRGVFTGPRTSSTALRVGLERDGLWEFPLHCDCLTQLFDRRVSQIQKGGVAGHADLTEVLRAPTLEEQEASLYYASAATGAARRGQGAGHHFGGSMATPPASATAAGVDEEDASPQTELPSHARRTTRGSFVIQPLPGRRETAVGTATATQCGETPASILEAIRSREQASLMASLQLVLDDMLALFSARATMNAELALPVMDLNSWRIFCADMHLLQLSPTVAVKRKVTTTAADPSPTSDAAISLAEGEEAPGARRDRTRPVRLLSVEMASRIFQQGLLSYVDADPSSVYQPNRPEQDPSASLSADGAGLAGSFSTPDSATMPPRSPSRSRSPSSAAVAPASPTGSALVVTHVPASVSATAVPLPTVRSYMTFPAFAIALTLVADYLYPDALVPAAEEDTNGETEETSYGDEDVNMTDASLPSSGSNRQKKSTVCWLGDALVHLVQGYMVANDVIAEGSSGAAVFDDPRSVITRLTSGLRTQEMLTWYSPCIVAVYNAYSRDVFGLAALQCEDVMRLLRDAMLTSTEISQYLVTELFQHSAITRSAQEEAVIARRREIDGKPREGAAGAASGASDKRKGGRSVRIVDPRSGSTSAAAATTTDVKVLTYDGFVQLLCVLCVFKQPNPLVPFDQRLGVFLRRSLLRPLTHKVDGLTMLLNRSKLNIRNPSGANGEDGKHASSEGQPA